MRNLKITSPLCLLPTGAGLLKSLSPKRERERERVKVLQSTKQKERGTRKEGGIKMENGAQVGGKLELEFVLGKMWDR